MEKDVKINYLYNSGFYIETEKHILIFDYYLDSVTLGDKQKENGAIGLDDLKTNKAFLVFATHGHFDHFNPVIFHWQNQVKNINYILSNDIKTPNTNKNIYLVDSITELNIDEAKIITFGSTDLGVSFLIKIDNITIFHSGDLNWWNWFDESDAYNLKMEHDFKKEISKIKKYSVDLAFLPVDPRLNDKFYLGGEYFINEINPKYFIPMHFGENYNITNTFSNKIASKSTDIIEITHRGEQFNLKI
ncbi:MBL fold metallo-hydrolase [Clostridium akagii]|uniref:MBL fold metallo-hydrolase n=1 Tax=Clostridium akagii TaxID=91623 RepID=UPI00047A4AC4|nr:MBL fold metallo-hydrolase [Clostridium akagii]